MNGNENGEKEEKDEAKKEKSNFVDLWYFYFIGIG